MRAEALLDRECRDGIIDKVKERENGYELTWDGWTLWCDKVQGIVPKPGDTLRMWGRGIGSTIRGIAINGQIVRYQTDAEMRVRHERETAESNRKKRAEAQAKSQETEARYRALPEVFRRRLDRFRAGNPDFWWNYQDYELFCCEQAVSIAAAMKEPDAVPAFTKLQWKQQKLVVPALSDQHSGNTFGMACRLAHWFLTHPENVVLEHGAMVPLVGCVDYGCTHDEAEAQDRRE